MSLVVAAPDAMAAAAADLAGINSTLSTANSSAAAAITGVLPAAGDEVSAAISALWARTVRPIRRSLFVSFGGAGGKARLFGANGLPGVPT